LTKLSRYIREAKQTDLEMVLSEIRENCGLWLKDPQAEGLLYRGTKNMVDVIEKRKTRLDNRRPKDMPNHLHDELNYHFKKKFGWKVRNGVFVTSNVGSARAYHHGPDPYIFMPIGKFEFVWSPDVDDLFADYFENGMMQTTEQLEDYYENNDYDAMRYYVDDELLIDRYFLYHIFAEKEMMEIDITKVGEYELPDSKHPEKIHKLEITKMDFNEFVEHYFEENYTPQEIVRLYTNRGLRDAIRSGKEMCFKCDEYYLIERKFEEDILEAFYT